MANEYLVVVKVCEYFEEWVEAENEDEALERIREIDWNNSIRIETDFEIIDEQLEDE